MESFELFCILVEPCNFLDKGNKIVAAPANGQASTQSFKGARERCSLGSPASHAVLDNHQMDIFFAQLASHQDRVIDLESNHIGQHAFIDAIKPTGDFIGD